MACECATWGDCRPLWVKHHKECPEYDQIRDATELITRLVRAMEAWSCQEDGIHPEAWDVCPMCEENNAKAAQLVERM